MKTLVMVMAIIVITLNVIFGIVDGVSDTVIEPTTKTEEILASVE